MGFMEPEVYETDYLEIDGPAGTEIIPCDVADYHPTEAMRDGSATDRFEIPSELADYCENRRAWSIERKHGWVGRMSAPGYMDATPWGASPTKEGMRAQLAMMYEGDDGDA